MSTSIKADERFIAPTREQGMDLIDLRQLFREMAGGDFLPSSSDLRFEISDSLVSKWMPEKRRVLRLTCISWLTSFCKKSFNAVPRHRQSFWTWTPYLSAALNFCSRPRTWTATTARVLKDVSSTKSCATTSTRLGAGGPLFPIVPTAMHWRR